MTKCPLCEIIHIETVERGKMKVIEQGSGKWEVYYEHDDTIHRTRYITLTRAGRAATKLMRELGITVTVMKNGIEAPLNLKSANF